MKRAGLTFGLLALLAPAAPAAQAAATKPELIRQAMSAMRIDARVRALVDARAEARVQAIRAANPGLSDSLVALARAAVVAVYEEGLEGPEGLFPRVRAVLDRRLSLDDLRFVIDFQGSDQGRRYREMVPRIVAECVEEGRMWAERREPEVRSRLEEALRGSGAKF